MGGRGNAVEEVPAVKLLPFLQDQVLAYHKKTTESFKLLCSYLCSQHPDLLSNMCMVKIDTEVRGHRGCHQLHLS